MKKIIFLLVLFSTLLFSAPFPVTWNGDMPSGTKADVVLQNKGKPDKTIGPVGEPAVEKWYYGKEIVVVMDGYVVDSFYLEWKS